MSDPILSLLGGILVLPLLIAYLQVAVALGLSVALRPVFAATRTHPE